MSDMGISGASVMKIGLILEKAVIAAGELNNEYVLPEHILIALTTEKTFCGCFERNGGNIEKFRKDIYAFLVEECGQNKKIENIEMSNDLEEVLRYATQEAFNSGRDQIMIHNLVSGILSLDDSFAAYFLHKYIEDIPQFLGEMSRENIQKENEDDFDMLADYEDNFEENEADQQWLTYVEYINETCNDKNPLIGREEELERTAQILSKMNKNNVLYVGEAGVGKTALVYGLAQQINNNTVAAALKDANIYGIDMTALVAGTQYHGELEKRLKMVIKGLEKVKHPILYIDEIGSIVGAGANSDGGMDVAGMLKPYLTDGKISFIGSTGYEEYNKLITKNKGLFRRFQKIDVKEPDIDKAVQILKGLKERYEQFHSVVYGEGVLEYAVEVSSKYINERFLPDKAIDLIDEAGAYKKLHKKKKKDNLVTGELIDVILAKTCNIPKQRVEQDDIKQLGNLSTALSKSIYGQQEAIENITNAIYFSKAGLLDANKPIASFLFVGPTGVGKTELAKELARILGIDFIRFDMSEYAEKHTVAKLIGSPAGYVGYEEGGILTGEIRKHPHAVLLLDEIEKAHQDIYNILLQVMDYATLTDNQGKKADFRNVIIIMTSNAGAAFIGKTQMGFGGGIINERAMDDAVKDTFSPEFRNRLSQIVRFNGMDDVMASNIANKKLKQLSDMLKEKNIKIKYTKAASEYVKNNGITREYGARQIDRIINSKIKPLLAKEILFGKLKNGGECCVDVTEGQFIIK